MIELCLARRVFPALLMTLGASSAFAQGACEQLIIDADDALVAAVEDRYETLSEDIDARYRLIDELLRPYFDLDFGSSMILYRYWDEATPEQRSRFSSAFYAFLVASFGHLVTEYRDDTLSVSEACKPFTRPWGNGFTLAADLKLTGDINETIRIGFVLREIDGQVRIIDIQHGGTSQTGHFRGQFLERLETEGLEPLVTWLEKEAELLREQQLGPSASGAGADAPDA